MTENDSIIVESHYRPLTRSARKALEEYGINDITNDKQTADDPYTVVKLEERPPAELLEKHELSISEDPLEEWGTERDEHICIYPDRVTVNGGEVNLSPEEAKERVRNEDRFTQLNT